MKTEKTKKISFFTRFGVLKLVSLVLLSILFAGLTYVNKIQTAAHEIDLEIERAGGQNVVSAVGTNPNIYGYPETILVPFRRN